MSGGSIWKVDGPDKQSASGANHDFGGKVKVSERSEQKNVWYTRVDGP